MKRLISVLSVCCLVLGLATAAMAANEVQVNSNSEPVTAIAGACEKAGNISFIFDGGTVLRDGDWITADLPIGVTLCSSFDFVVLGAIAAVVPGPGGFNDIVVAPLSTLDAQDGLWSMKNGGVAAGGLNITGSPMFFRVRGSASSNRLRIDVYDSDVVAAVNGVTPINNPANYNGSSTFVLASETSFQLNLFDSQLHNGIAPSTGIWAWNDTPFGVQTAGDGIYGNAPALADRLLLPTENTYCITIDRDIYAGNTINASINSGGQSGNNFLTFSPSNPQVAHLITAATFTLDDCKDDPMGYVPLAGGDQADTCTFLYRNANNMCPTATFGGNTLIIQNNTGTFYDPLDQYVLTVIVSGDGSYLGGVPTVRKYLPTQDPCAEVPVTRVPTDGTAVALTWPVITTETGATAGVAANGVGCQPIDPDEEWVSVTSAPFTAIDQHNALRIDLPIIVYDSAVVAAGDQVTVTVRLDRLPCGLIFQASRTIAEYVDNCAAAAPNTTLYYPYAVALDGSQGWWYGMTIGNPTAVGGDAAITVAEMDGDIGTATVAVGALGLVVMGGADLLAVLTPDAANTGTLGDSPCHIIAICTFGSAGGFGMQGDGVDSTGYLANGVAGNVVAPWAY